MNRIWIVEMFNHGNGRWEPTVGARLSREDARKEIEKWRQGNKDDRFRLAVYARIGRKK
jgi:hypothetical protein